MNISSKILMSMLCLGMPFALCQELIVPQQTSTLGELIAPDITVEGSVLVTQLGNIAVTDSIVIEPTGKIQLYGEIDEGPEITNQGLFEIYYKGGAGAHVTKITLKDPMTGQLIIRSPTDITASADDGPIVIG
jgi:hypothetical protein